MKHRETSSFEFYENDDGGFTIEFRCLQCRELLTCDLEDASQLFEVTCPHCERVIQCRLTLHMDVFP